MLQAILARFRTAQLLINGTIPGNSLDQQKKIREALRTLGVLKDIRGSTAGLVCEVDVTAARQLAITLLTEAEIAEQKQRQVWLWIKKKS